MQGTCWACQEFCRTIGVGAETINYFGTTATLFIHFLYAFGVSCFEGKNKYLKKKQSKPKIMPVITNVLAKLLADRNLALAKLHSPLFSIMNSNNDSTWLR